MRLGVAGRDRRKRSWMMEDTPGLTRSGRAESLPVSGETLPSRHSFFWLLCHVPGAGGSLDDLGSPGGAKNFIAPAAALADFSAAAAASSNSSGVR
jgi:hypothetical protein